MLGFLEKRAVQNLGYRSCSSSLFSTQFIRYQSNFVHTCISHVKVKPLDALKNRTFANYVSSPNSKLQSLIWPKPIQNVFIVKKPWSNSTTRAMVEFIHHLHDKYPAVNVIVEQDTVEQLRTELLQSPKNSNCKLDRTHDTIFLFTGTKADIVNKTDLLVTLGGDGTILKAVSLFSTDYVPPVLPFSMGTLGFLLPFQFQEYAKVFDEIMHGRGKVLYRTRLECYITKRSQKNKLANLKPTENTSVPSNTTQNKVLTGTNASSEKNTSIISNKESDRIVTKVHAMNDIFLHRGDSPHLTYLDIYIDGDFLTRTTADGVVLSTPTGSTAYSLSAGGSIVSPRVPCIMLTPICPRSLSFRPLILPQTSHIKIKIGSKRNAGLGDPESKKVKLNIDGIPHKDLEHDDEIHIVNEVGTIYLNSNTNIPYYKNDSISNPDFLDEGFKKMPNYSKLTGVHCVARAENDWTSGINELLGFNSSFRERQSEDS